MIITAKPYSTFSTQTFELEGDNYSRHGELGGMDPYQPILLTTREETHIFGVFEESSFWNYIPYRYLFGKENVTHIFRLYKNDEKYGLICFSEHGYMKSGYSITLESGEEFLCYYYGEGSFKYISIYHDSEQIALIETFLNVDDYQYTHKLYLLDAYNKYADLLSFFVLYYANFNFVVRRRIGIGSTSRYERVRSYSNYDDKFDPTWRERNFPDENFFGKIDPYGLDK